MRTINKILVVPLIALSLASCKNESKIPNLGVAEIPLVVDGKQVTGQVVDIDNDEKVDGVLVNSAGQEYLLMYKEGYQYSPEFRELYNPAKSKAFQPGDREKLSKYLFLNNVLQAEKAKK